jgi:Family of unknown function (DUF5760)
MSYKPLNDILSDIPDDVSEGDDDVASVQSHKSTYQRPVVINGQVLTPQQIQQLQQLQRQRQQQQSIPQAPQVHGRLNIPDEYRRLAPPAVAPVPVKRETVPTPMALTESNLKSFTKETNSPKSFGDDDDEFEVRSHKSHRSRKSTRSRKSHKSHRSRHSDKSNKSTHSKKSVVIDFEVGADNEERMISYDLVQDPDHMSERSGKSHKSHKSHKSSKSHKSHKSHKHKKDDKERKKEEQEIDTMGFGKLCNTNTSTEMKRVESMEEYKGLLREYTRVNNEMKTLLKAVKERRDQKKMLEKRMAVFMQEKQIDEVINKKDKQRIELVTRKRSTGMKKGYIKEKMTELFANESTADKITRFLYEKRAFTEESVIRVVDDSD